MFWAIEKAIWSLQKSNKGRFVISVVSESLTILEHFPWARPLSVYEPFFSAAFT